MYKIASNMSKDDYRRALINYDAFTGSPLGRTFRIGVRKRW